MSKIALAGNASGTGTITLASPNTNTDFTINLPAASGTLVTTGGTVTFGAGSAAAPSITNTTNTNTGIYFPAVDTIGFTEGGVESFRLNSSGEGVFAGNVLAAGNLTVAGSAQVGGITTNLYPLVSGTAQNASGTSVDFTGIPSWVKRITVMFQAVSTNGSSERLIQLGTGSTTYVNSGYLGTSSSMDNLVGTTNFTTGFGIRGGDATAVLNGNVVITNINGNSWTANGNLAFSNGAASVITAGSIALGAALTAVRITTVSGINVFDSGVLNILYE
jgi:hypothetical protein